MSDHGAHLIARLAAWWSSDPRPSTLATSAPCEATEDVAVTVDCDDGWRRYVDPTRLRPELRLVRLEDA